MHDLHDHANLLTSSLASTVLKLCLRQMTFQSYFYSLNYDSILESNKLNSLYSVIRPDQPKRL